MISDLRRWTFCSVRWLFTRLRLCWYNNTAGGKRNTFSNTNHEWSMSLHTQSYDLWVVYIDVVQHCTAYKKPSSLSHHELSCTREPLLPVAGRGSVQDEWAPAQRNNTRVSKASRAHSMIHTVPLLLSSQAENKRLHCRRQMQLNQLKPTHPQAICAKNIKISITYKYMSLHLWASTRCDV